MLYYTKENIFFIGKKKYIDKKRTKRLSKSILEVEVYKREPNGGQKREQEETKNQLLMPLTYNPQTHLHPNQAEKSNKEFVLSIVYKFSQDHKILKKLAFII